MIVTWLQNTEKLRTPLRSSSQQRQRGRRRRGFESDGEEHDVFVGIVLGQLQCIDRRIDDANVHAARFVLERAAIGARHAHHVAEGCEDHIGPRCDGETVVDAPHREDADRAARTVNQLDVVGKQVLESEAIDGVGVAAAHFHQAVVTAGIGEPPDLLRGLRNRFGVTKLIYESHGDSPCDADSLRP